MPEEANLEVVHGGKRHGRRIREELERHRRRVVRDADPIRTEGREVGEAEEGLELAVGAELEVDGGGGAVGGDGGVEGGDDLGGEGGAGDGADGVAGVVGEVVFVGVGEGADLEESVRGEEGGGGDGGVVDGGDVEVVEDWEGGKDFVSLAGKKGGENGVGGRRFLLE